MNQYEENQDHLATNMRKVAMAVDPLFYDEIDYPKIAEILRDLANVCDMLDKLKP